MSDQWWDPSQPTQAQAPQTPPSAPPPRGPTYDQPHANSYNDAYHDAPEQAWNGDRMPGQSGGSPRSRQPWPTMVVGALALGAAGLILLVLSSQGSKTTTTPTTFGSASIGAAAVPGQSSSPSSTNAPGDFSGSGFIYGFPETHAVGSYCARVLGYEYEVKRYMDLVGSARTEAEQYQIDYEFVSYTILILGDIAEVAPLDLQNNYLRIQQPWINSTSMDSINQAFENDTSLLAAEDQVFDHMNTQCAAFYDG